MTASPPSHPLMAYGARPSGSSLHTPISGSTTSTRGSDGRAATSTLSPGSCASTSTCRDDCMGRLFPTRMATLAALLLVAGRSHASIGYPEVIRQKLALTYTPSCAICHENASG